MSIVESRPNRALLPESLLVPPQRTPARQVAIWPAKSKYLWLYSAENVAVKSRERFDLLKGAHLKTRAPKESLRELWDCRRETQAAEF